MHIAKYMMAVLTVLNKESLKSNMAISERYGQYLHGSCVVHFIQSTSLHRSN